MTLITSSVDQTTNATALQCYKQYYVVYSVELLHYCIIQSTRAPHSSGRAGQHFEFIHSILGRAKKVTTHNRSLRVQYVR